MTTPVSSGLSSGEYVRYLDAQGTRYDLILRYLTALAEVESERHVPAQTAAIDTQSVRGPEFVRDVMVSRVISVDEDAVFKEIVHALARNRISAVPVLNDQRQVVGVVSESDLLARVSGSLIDLPKGHRRSGGAETRAKMHAATARELMTSPPVCTAPDKRIADAAKQAADARVRRMPVVDSNGVLLGIVARAELLRPFLRPDEHIRDDVERKVMRAVVTDQLPIGVLVQEGVVTLAGQVESPAARKALVDSVHAVSGVIDVDCAALTTTHDSVRRQTPPRVPLY
jgi:CBS domain-containing protein